MAQTLIKFTAETNDYERKVRQATKSFKEFTNGIGLSTSKFTAMGAAIGATTAALKVAKDAFFQNEQNLDEWGRTVQASKSLYQGFINSLNNANFSGFISNMSKITQAARDAYDAMDALGTFNAFNQINVEKTRTGMTESIAAYREGTGSTNDVKTSAAAYKKELETRRKFEQDAYKKRVYDIAAQRQVNGDDLFKALSGTYGSYSKLKEVPMTGRRMVTVGGGMFGGGSYHFEPYAKTDRERLGAALRQFNDTELQSLQALGAQAERTANEIAQVDKTVARITRGGNGTSGGSTTPAKTGRGGRGGATETYNPVKGSIDWQQDEVARLTKLWQAAGDEGVRNGYKVQLEDAKKVLNEMMGIVEKVEEPKPEEAPTFSKTGYLGSLQEQLSMHHQALAEANTPEQYQTIVRNIEDVQRAIDDFTGISAIRDQQEQVEALEKSWQSAADAIGTVGSALQMIENPGAKVLGIIAEAIANIALTFSQSLKGTFTPWDWIAAAASGTATMISTIAAIKSATSGSYATGGIVGGNGFSGDNTIIAANAGELILNKAQQQSVASQLGGLAYSNLQLTATLHGEDIRLALDYNGRRRGRGELVTSRRG